MNNNMSKLNGFNRLVSQILDTLTDFCIGPCHENQNILCKIILNNKICFFIKILNYFHHNKSIMNIK